MSAWPPQPLVNTVYDALLSLSKNGTVPVQESELLAELKRRGEEVSRRDLGKALLTLEILGYIEAQTSKDELLISVKPGRE